MKSFFQHIALSIVFLVSFTANAQFLKKLAKKVTQEAEQTAMDKSARKANDKVDKSIDNVFSFTPDSVKAKSSQKPNSAYTFKFLYKMNINADGQSITMDYYLQPNSDYIGMSMNQNDMQSFSVIDHEKSTAFNFMEHEGQKIQSAINLDASLIPDAEDNSFSTSDYKVTTLPQKNILGFSCKGTQLENGERTIILYYTDEMEVSFSQVMLASQNQPESMKGMDAHFPNPDKNMLLYMETTEKKGRKKGTATMKCEAFEEVNKTFKTSGYTSF